MNAAARFFNHILFRALFKNSIAKCFLSLAPDYHADTHRVCGGETGLLSQLLSLNLDVAEGLVIISYLPKLY